MGKPAVVGAQDIEIYEEAKEFRVAGTVIKEGKYITIDGTTGRVIEGEVPLVEPEIKGEFLELLEIADEIKTLGVRANADTPIDAKKALEFGAEGIGLTRTEHMFMAQERLPVVQKMIMAQTIEERQDALNKILPMQKGDFYEIFKIMEGKPVTIRLLDPPLHEFLPELTTVQLEQQELKMTNALSKALLDINGKTLLERQMGVLKRCNVQKFVVIRGFQKYKFKIKNIKYYDNDDYKNGFVVDSLFRSEKEIEEKFIFLNSDILFSEFIIKNLIDTN